MPEPGRERPRPGDRAPGDRNGPAMGGRMQISPMLDGRNDTPSSWQMAGLDVRDRALHEMGWVER
ncbi:hypothetical protein GCM10022221_49660 [Actinocorallia aurea]